MSDGPEKLASKPAMPLDEIILGDDEVASVPPVVAAPPLPAGDGRSSVRPKEHTPSVRPRSDPDAVPLGSRPPSAPETRELDGDGARDSVRERRRAKLTLRIPDDEVSRPTMPSGETPAGGIPALMTPAPGPTDTRASRPPPVVALSGSVPPAPPVASVPPATSVPPVADGAARPGSFAPPRNSPPDLSADDTLELPAGDVRRRLAALTADGAPALGVDAASDPGWTPFQPQVELAREEPVVSPVHRAAAPVLDLDVTEDEEAGPTSEDIPVETVLDDAEPTQLKLDDRDEDEPVTHPRLPHVLDSEEIRLEESERSTDPGPEEVSLDDLVSVESLPNPGAPPPLRGPKAGAASAQPTTATATALMAGTPPDGVASAPAPVVVLPEVLPVIAPPAVAQAAVTVTPTVTPVSPASPATPVATGVPPAAPSPLPASSFASPVPAPSPAPPAATPAPSSSPIAVVASPGSAPSGPVTAARRVPSNPGLAPIGALAPPPMTETAANRKKTRPWWEDLFNDDYIRTMAKLSDGQIGKEVDFIEESLGCEAGAMILDLACGTGRHAVELAARGYQVVGFDLSLSMLARASDEAQDRKQKINFVQGDMREMTFEETFDGIYSWNTSFGYFDEEKNAAIVAKVHRALKKGGQFLLDVVNRDNVIRQSPSLAWYEGDGCICMDEMHIDWITSRMKVKRTLMMDDVAAGQGGGRESRTKEIEYSIRVYSLHELGKLLHDNGFRVAEVSGLTGSPGVFFGCEAPRTLILAEKR
jgi:SAM-dependent methyltransferase